MSIEGDFELTLGYRDFQSMTQSVTHQVPRVEMILALGGGIASPQHAQTLAMTHRRANDGKMHLASILGVRRNPPAEDWVSSDRALMATQGRIRIVRRGNTAYYMHSDYGADKWEVLDRRPVSGANVKDLMIGLRSEDLMGSGSVTLTEFSIRAKRFQYRPQFRKDELPAQFSWNVQEPVPAQIRGLAVEPPNRFEPLADGTKIVRPDAPQQKRKPVGFNWQGSLHGDFEVTLSYRAFESTTKITDWQIPRIEINVPIENADGNSEHKDSVAAFHVRRADGSMRHAGGHNVRDADKKVAWKGADVATTNSSGRLRVIRQGTTLFSLAAAPGSDDFQLVFSNPLSDGDVNSISFTIRGEGEASEASVVFNEISIRAQSFDAPMTKVKPSTEANSLPSKVAATVPGPLPFEAKDLPAKVAWNFQGPRPRAFNESGNKKRNQLVTQSDGVKLIRSPKVDSSDQAIGYLLAGGLAGDFEITLDYRDFLSTSVPKDTNVPCVDVRVVIHSTAKPAELVNTAGIAHRRNHDATLKIVSTHGDKGPDGKFIDKTIESTTDRISGRLRLVRQGTAMFTQVAAFGSDDWMTISRATVDAGLLKSLSLGLRAEDLDSTAEAVFTNITIRANALIP